jgi:putative ABC transport system permease protein
MDEGIVRPPVDREVDEEVRFHVEMRVRELVARGMDEGEARAEAVRRFGDIDRVKADLRHLGERRDVAMNRRRWWDELRQDLAFAARQLRRTPSFATVAILTLTLAIGANTAVFSVVEGVLLKPLPYAQPDRLVDLWTKYLPPSGFDIAKFSLSGPEFLDYAEETSAFSSLGAYQPGGSRAITGDGQDAERVRVTFVGAAVLPVLGVKPALGRWFTAQEDAPDAPPATILSHDLWASRYASDPDVVGRSISMNGTATEVVGIMPAGFAFGGDAKAYLPLGLTRASEGNREGHSYSAIGRLAPGATLADVDAELAVLRDRWAAAYQHNVGHFVWAAPLKDDRLGDAPHVLYLLLSAVGLVLLVACVNTANLLLARGERRMGEVAVRRALGAGRGRLTRQLVTESLVLALLAALLALPLAAVGTRALIGLDPRALPRLDEVRVDPLVLAFTLGVALVTALLFGAVPGWLVGRGSVAAVAGSGGRSVGGRHRAALRRVLVTAEVAVSLVVVILAGLLVRSFGALVSTDPGFRADNALAFGVSLPKTSYPDDQRTFAEYRRLLDGVRAVPGVVSVTAATDLPFGGGMMRWDFELADRPPRQAGERAWNAGITSVMPDYFETLGIPILEGRGITRDDQADAPLVGVVSETMARVYWPGQSALGKRWGYGRDNGQVPWITVVGVARDRIVDHVGEETVPQVYVPEAQDGVAAYYIPRALQVVARTGVDPLSVTSAVRAAVKEFDPDLPLANVRAMRDVVSSSMARPRLATSLLGAFALLALVLAAVGIYGVVSYSVAGRTREIGVRVALGARRGDVMRMIVREGATPVALGVAVGLGGAWLASGLVRTMLYGVAPTDALTFTALPTALLALGIAASLLPARRATRIAPTEALREE